MDAIAGFESAMEPRGIAGHVIPAARAPSAEQRGWMARRVESLDDALKPAGDQERREEFGLLLSVCAVSPGSEINAKVAARVYLEDLADLPMFALKAACAYFRRTAKWLPSIAEIREKALAEVQIFRNERHRVQKVLDARVLAPEPGADRKAEVLAKWREEIRPALQATSMQDASMVAKRQPPTREQLAAWAAIEKGLPDPRPPVTVLSDAARAAIGLPVDDPREAK